MHLSKQFWNGKISNTSQVGGIEISVLQEGAARGTRIAWINTGTGLRYKVVIDRGMDIADAFFNQYSLTWISHGGITSPRPDSNRKLEWLRSFTGGLLITCGLDHVGGPESDEHGDRGLHGMISNTPAEIESVIQPDIARGKLDFSITGKMKETKVFGPSFELRRTISGSIGQPFIKIIDEVTNCANTSMPHMLLYHCNFGWPLVDEGADLLWKGNWSSPGEQRPDKIFREGNDFKKCPAPLEAHRSTGEEVAFIDVAADPSGQCLCGISNSKMGIALALRFNKQELPWLTNWQHWGPGEYVTGIEPGTHPPIGQASARREGSLIFLKPRETRVYNLRIEVLDDTDSINQLIKHTSQ